MASALWEVDPGVGIYRQATRSLLSYSVVRVLHSILLRVTGRSDRNSGFIPHPQRAYSPSSLDALCISAGEGKSCEHPLQVQMPDETLLLTCRKFEHSVLSTTCGRMYRAVKEHLWKIIDHDTNALSS
jgi:hypothetical protein